MKKLASLFSVLALSMVLFFSCKGEDDFSTLTNEQKVTLLTSFKWVEDESNSMSVAAAQEMPIQKEMCPPNYLLFNGTTVGTLIEYEDCEMTEYTYTYDPSTNKITKTIVEEDNEPVMSSSNIASVVAQEIEQPESMDIEITDNTLKIGDYTYTKGDQK